MVKPGENGIVEEGPPVRRASLKIRFAAALGVRLLSIVGRTWRIEWIGKDLIEEWDRKGCIFAFWHGNSLIPCWAYRMRGVAVMVSLHRDGEIMNRALASLGFKRIRGSSTKGGRAALNAMIDILEKGSCAAVTPDGPRGPRHSVHPGVFMLASKTGKPILPCGIGAKNFWRLRTWDAFLVPKPFTIVRIVAGDPIFVPRDLSRKRVDELGRELKKVLMELNGVAEKFGKSKG